MGFLLVVAFFVLLPVETRAQGTPWVYLHFPDEAITKSYQDGRVFTEDPRALKVYVSLHYPNSVTAMFSEKSDFAGAAWEPYIYLVGSNVKEWQFSPEDGVKKLYIRIKDSQGKIEETSIQYTYDTAPPFGGIALSQNSVGPDTLLIDLYLGVNDNLTESNRVGMRIGKTSDLSNSVWQAFSPQYKWSIDENDKQVGGDKKKIYVQYRDLAENVSDVYEASYTVDKQPPVIYIEVPPSDKLEQTIGIYAYDELSELGEMRISNDPLLFEGVKEMPYQERVVWQFDARRVVWVQLSDSVGNWTEPYPAYLAPLVSPTGTILVPTKVPIPTIDPTMAADPRYLEFQQRVADLEKGQQDLKTTNANLQEAIQVQSEKVGTLERLVDSVVAFLKSIFPFWK